MALVEIEIVVVIIAMMLMMIASGNAVAAAGSCDFAAGVPPAGACDGPLARVLARRASTNITNQGCGIGEVFYYEDGSLSKLKCGSCVPGTDGASDDLQMCPLNEYCNDQAKCVATTASPTFKGPCPYETGISTSGWCGAGLRCIQHVCLPCEDGVYDAVHHRLCINNQWEPNYWAIQFYRDAVTWLLLLLLLVFLLLGTVTCTCTALPHLDRLLRSWTHALQRKRRFKSAPAAAGTAGTAGTASSFSRERGGAYAVGSPASGKSANTGLSQPSSHVQQQQALSSSPSTPPHSSNRYKDKEKERSQREGDIRPRPHHQVQPSAGGHHLREVPEHDQLPLELDDIMSGDMDAAGWEREREHERESAARQQARDRRPHLKQNPSQRQLLGSHDNYSSDGSSRDVGEYGGQRFYR
jgi:hypothetical protein